MVAATVLLGISCHQVVKLEAVSPQRHLVMAPSQQSAPATAAEGEQPVEAELQPAALPPHSPILPATAPAPPHVAVSSTQGCAASGFPARGCPPP